MPRATQLPEGLLGLQVPANRSCCQVSQAGGASSWTLHSLVEHRVSGNQPQAGALQPLSVALLQLPGLTRACAQVLGAQALGKGHAAEKCGEGSTAGQQEE